jgi:hypothetical protein
MKRLFKENRILINSSFSLLFSALLANFRREMNLFTSSESGAIFV